MALPSIVTPEYKTIIPSTKQEIIYRPFLVKEEKLLLMASESDDEKEQVLAIAKILSQCILTEGIEIGSLAPFDLEYLFLNIRAKSVGEILELNLRHYNPDSPTGTLESSCEHVTEYQLNIEDIAIPGPLPDTKIQLTDNLGVVLRFPTFQDIAITEEDMNAEVMFNLISQCVEYVYDNEEVYNDFTAEEMHQWMENLGQVQFEKITNFFENLPRLTHEIKWKCSACGRDDSLVLEGVQSFFT